VNLAYKCKYEKKIRVNIAAKYKLYTNYIANYIQIINNYGELYSKWEK
jgi:hypothetical protein